MAKDFQNVADANPVPASVMTKEQALIHVIKFLNSRMSAMSPKSVDKAKELIGLHEISASELVNKYVDLVYSSS